MDRRLMVTLMVSLVAIGSAGVVAAQDAPGSLCLFSADEMSELIGVPIATVEAVETECAYTADTTERSIQVVIGLVPPDPLAPTDEDPLWMIHNQHRSNGEEATISGQPAWVADDGAWVDVGGDVFFVWPNVIFDDDPPPMPQTAVAVATEAIPRYIASQSSTRVDGDAGATAAGHA